NSLLGGQVRREPLPWPRHSPLEGWIMGPDPLVPKPVAQPTEAPHLRIVLQTFQTTLDRSLSCYASRLLNLATSQNANRPRRIMILAAGCCDLQDRPDL